MISVSQLFKDYSLLPERQVEAKVSINGVEYLNDAVISVEIDRSILSGDDLTFGEVISASAKFKLMNPKEIPSNAAVEISVRLNGEQGPTEWLKLGDFYVDSREFNNGIWTFNAFDALIRANQLYVSALSYPATFNAVFTEIKSITGITADDATNTMIQISSFEVPYKDTEATINEVLSYMASAFGANCIIDNTGKLSFRKLSNAIKTPITRSQYSIFKRNNTQKTITKTKIIYNKAGEFIEIGTGNDDYTMQVYNPYAAVNPAIANAIHAAANGLSYTPMDLEWRGLFYTEPGDFITVTEASNVTWKDMTDAWEDTYMTWAGESKVESLIAKHKITIKGGLKCNSSITSDTKTKAESPFSGSISRQITKIDKEVIKADTPYNNVTISKTNGITIERTDQNATINLDALNGITIENNIETVFFIDTNGNLQIKGNITMTGGSIVWDSIDAPSYSQITGVKPPADADNTISVIGANRLTYIGPTGIYTGTLTADQVNAVDIDAGSITTGTLSANFISGGTISGVTIDVTTDATIGNNLYVGGVDGIRFENDADTSLYTWVAGVRSERYFANAHWVNGDIGILSGRKIGAFSTLTGAPTSISGITFTSSLVNVDINAEFDGDVTFNAAKTAAFNDCAVTGLFANGLQDAAFANSDLRLYSDSSNYYFINKNNANAKQMICREDLQIAFFSGGKVNKQAVTDPSAITTTQTADLTYDSTERDMLNNLKTDVTNIRNKLGNLIDALQAYNLV